MTAFFPLLIIICSSFIMIHPIHIWNLLWNESSTDLHVDKLTYLSTMLLSVIALRLSFVDKMPRIPYLSLFDLVFLLCYFILFGMMCVAAGGQLLAARASIPAFVLFLYYRARDTPYIQKFGFGGKKELPQSTRLFCSALFSLVTTACYFIMFIVILGAAGQQLSTCFVFPAFILILWYHAQDTPFLQQFEDKLSQLPAAARQLLSALCFAFVALFLVFMSG